MTEPEKKPNRREQAKARTKAKILAAATKLFAEEGGYAKATIRSIAKEAGMSTGAFFASFLGKENVYREIYGHFPITPENGRRMARIIDHFLNSDTPPNAEAHALMVDIDFPGYSRI